EEDEGDTPQHKELVPEVELVRHVTLTGNEGIFPEDREATPEQAEGDQKCVLRMQHQVLTREAGPKELLVWFERLAQFLLKGVGAFGRIVRVEEGHRQNFRRSPSPIMLPV